MHEHEKINGTIENFVETKAIPYPYSLYYARNRMQTSKTNKKIRYWVYLALGSKRNLERAFCINTFRGVMNTVCMS
jgi:hypothetical protein